MPTNRLPIEQASLKAQASIGPETAQVRIENEPAIPIAKTGAVPTIPTHCKTSEYGLNRFDFFYSLSGFHFRPLTPTSIHQSSMIGC